MLSRYDKFSALIIFEKKLTVFAVERPRGDDDLGRFYNNSVDVNDLEFDLTLRVFTDDVVSVVFRWHRPKDSRKSICLRYLGIYMPENLALDSNIAGLLPLLRHLRIGFRNLLGRILGYDGQDS